MRQVGLPVAGTHQRRLALGAIGGDGDDLANRMAQQQHDVVVRHGSSAAARSGRSAPIRSRARHPRAPPGSGPRSVRPPLIPPSRRKPSPPETVTGSASARRCAVNAIEKTLSWEKARLPLPASAGGSASGAHSGMRQDAAGGERSWPARSATSAPGRQASREARRRILSYVVPYFISLIASKSCTPPPTRLVV